MARLVGVFLDKAKAPKNYSHEEIKRSDYNPIMFPTILIGLLYLTHPVCKYTKTKFYKY